MLLLGGYIIIVISTRVRPTRWAAHSNILYFISLRASVARDREKRDSSSKRGVARWLYNSVNVYIIIIIIII